MDRSTLLALSKLHRATATAISAVAPKGAEPTADAVYEAARVLRRRIDAALAASRLDPQPSDPKA
jgi:hypothetical protein